MEKIVYEGMKETQRLKFLGFQNSYISKLFNLCLRL